MLTTVDSVKETAKEVAEKAVLPVEEAPESQRSRATTTSFDRDDCFKSEESEQAIHWGWWLFDRAIRVVIVINVACLGLREVYPAQAPTWWLLENAFTTIFVLEMIIKLKVMGKAYGGLFAN